MTKAWAVALVLVACKSSEDFPIDPGGGGGGGSGSGSDYVDAAIDAPPDAAPVDIAGQICLVGTDLRNLGCVSAVNADGFTVELEGVTTTTNSNGTFFITVPTPTSEVFWHVTKTGGAFVESLVRFAPGDLSLPVIKQVDYQALLDGNGVVFVPGNGSVVAQVATTGGLPVVGTTVTVNGGAPTFYDGADSLVWDTDSTGQKGIAWMPNNTPGTRKLLVMPATPPSFDLPLTADAITFITIVP